MNADALDTLASDRELNSTRTDLQNAINGKADTNHGHGIDDVSGLRTELNGKASTASVAGLASSLSLKVNANALDTLASDRELNNARNALQAGINGKADTNHRHRIGNIDGLNAALNSKANRLDVEIMANTLRRKTDSIAVANTIHDSLAAHCYVSCSRLESICRSYDSVIDRMQRSMDVLRSAIAEFVVTTEDEGCECTGTSIAVDGALPGLFSVSATKRVRFSMGNLMYSNSGRHECADGSIQDGTFRFADCACEYIGSSNRFSSSTFIGWIDFFGWGTSGYHNEDDPYNVNYYPYSTATAIVNTSYNTYGYGPSRGNNNWSINLIDASKYYDWGVYNAISNGGNQPGLWRVLTQDEWRYLAYTRTASTIGDTVNARFCKATVREVSGLILFPDNYTHPDGVPTPQKCNATGRNAVNQPDPDATYTANNYNTEEWQAMEAAGAVFLPAAGWRDDSGNILKTNINGNYWSSTTSNQSSAKYFNFEPDQMQFDPAASKHRGRNVRLVQDVE